MRWFTSDTHFGHANIIRYCDRPFYTVDDMNVGIVERHNSLVNPGDDVWWLGDVALGHLADSLACVDLCHGQKTLVVGNHDRPFRLGGKKKPPSPAWDQTYRDAGFSTIIHGSTKLTLRRGPAVTVCHFPYSGDSGPADRFVHARPVDNGSWLLCGHIHETWRQRGRQINVGVDAWGGEPVPEQTIIDLINAGPADRDRLEWI